MKKIRIYRGFQQEYSIPPFHGNSLVIVMFGNRHVLLKGWGEVILGLLISFLLLYCFYPGFMLFNQTPMFANGWELKDPIVSPMTFRPSFRVFQYELYNHYTTLWSSLRAMGMPLLAYDIQTAPLFPLTLVLSWLHEDIFWNVFVICQLVLMAFGVYLLVRKFFGFKRLPAVLFILSFIYSLYVMRWMNHPWQNGLLAGIWYLYFLCLTIVQGKDYSLKRLAVFLGLVLSVYSMVTCGFPEAAVMSAFLVVFTYVPLFIQRVIKKQILWKSYLQDLILAHIAGFALASYQLFSVIELHSFNEGQRKVGLVQHSASDLIPFFAEILTKFGQKAPTLFEDSRTFLGLIPLLFFLFGIVITIKRFKRIGYGEIGAILCGLFIVFKLFAIGPSWFNTLSAKSSILLESFFYIYFFTLFLWFFAYFTAKGFQVFSDSLEGSSHLTIGFTRAMMILIPVGVVSLAWFAAPIATNESLINLLFVKKHSELRTIFILFASTVALINIGIYFRNNNLLRVCLPLGIVVLTIIEVATSLPSSFSTLRSADNPQIESLLTFLENKGLDLTETRTSERYGKYASYGLPTVDTGATALIPLRTKLFRRKFFETGAFGRQPIKQPRNNLAFGLTSTNIRFLDRFCGGMSSPPDWTSMTLKEGGKIRFDSLRFNGKQLNLQQPATVHGSYKDLFRIQGWGIASKTKGVLDLSAYVIFVGDTKEIVVPTKKANRPDVAKHLRSKDFMKAGWQSYFSAGIFDTGTYKIIIRLVDKSNNEYYEYRSNSKFTFTTKEISNGDTFKYGAGSDGDQMEYIAILGNWHVYYDKGALPRAYIASKCHSFPNLKSIISNFMSVGSGFELGHVNVEQLNATETTFCAQYDGNVSRVPIQYEKGNELLLSPVSGPSIMVLNDNFYPGWRAVDTLTGRELDIKPANLTFRTVLLPEQREYHIKFQYKPQWLVIARGLLALSCFIIVTMTFITLKKPRESISTSP